MAGCDDWYWFKDCLARHDDDSPLESDWPGARDLLHDGDLDWYRDDDLVGELIDSSSDSRYADESGVGAFFERITASFAARFPEEPVVFMDREWPARTLAGMVFGAVVERLLVTVQNHEGGFVGLGWDPAWGGNDVWLRAAASSLDGFEMGSLATGVLERILAPGEDPREIMSLAVRPEHGFTPDTLAEVVWIPAEHVDAGAEVDRAVTDTLGAGGEWLESTGDVFALASAVRTTLAGIAESANSLAPSFVRELGQITLRVADPQRWSDAEPRTIVAFRLDSGEEVDARALGAATRRWIHASVAEAARQLVLRSRKNTHRPGRPRRLVLVDEPELHLHPTAQVEIADWLRRLTDNGDCVLAASHSPAILARADQPVGLLRVAGTPMLFPMGADLLGIMDDLARSLGIDRGSWLQLMRAVLIVEGQHDVRIIRHFFGTQLSEARVPVFALRGTRNADALIDSEFLGRAGVRLLVLFDSVRETTIAGRAEEDLTAEEKKMRKLLQQLDHQTREGHDVRPVPYAEPDIICSLPVSAVRRSFPRTTLRDWAPVIQAWERAGRPGFKPFALKAIGLRDVVADVFVEEVLRSTTDREKPSPALQTAVRHLLNGLG